MNDHFNKVAIETYLNDTWDRAANDNSKTRKNDRLVVFQDFKMPFVIRKKMSMGKLLEIMDHDTIPHCLAYRFYFLKQIAVDDVVEIRFGIGNVSSDAAEFLSEKIIFVHLAGRYNKNRHPSVKKLNQDLWVEFEDSDDVRKYVVRKKDV